MAFNKHQSVEVDSKYYNDESITMRPNASVHVRQRLTPPVQRHPGN